MNKIKTIMEKIKVCLKTTKGKIIAFSSVSVIVLVIIIGIVVGSVDSGHGHDTYKGTFKKDMNTADYTAWIDLNSLKIGKTNNTLKGKILSVKKGIVILTALNWVSDKFSGNNLFKQKVTVKINPDSLSNKVGLDPLICKIWENTTKDRIIIKAISDKQPCVGFKYTLPLSW